MTPRISVIIPVYNGESFIAQAIQSVLDQEYPAHEIIVIDDGSTDNTPAVLERFRDKIITRRTSNLGVSNARNAGLEIAVGDYIAFLDADDVWFKNKLKKQVEAIRKYPEAGFICSDFAVRYRDMGGRMRLHFSILRNKREMNFDSPLKNSPFRLLVEENFIGTGSCATVKRSVALEAGFFKMEYNRCEEFDYFLRCALLTDFIVLSDVLFYKRTHSSNLSHDQIFAFTAHKKILIDTMAHESKYIQENRLTRVFKFALAKTNYDIGDLYFNEGDVRSAFRFYGEGLRSAFYPANFIRFIWAIVKKICRTLSFGLIQRKALGRLKTDLRKRAQKFSFKKRLKRKWDRSVNFWRRWRYQTGYSRFKRDVPKVDQNRESFEKLLLFLVNNVVQNHYDGKRGYFKRDASLQVSEAGHESDLMELAARSFIGVGFYLVHNDSEELAKLYLGLIRKGTDPGSRFFWGRIKSDQIVVENTSVIIGLLLNKEKLWDRLSNTEKEGVIGYIKSSLKRRFHDNNWLWFKIFHYLFLEGVAGEKYTKEIQELLKRLDGFYAGDGWYNDGSGKQENCYDYYNAWAFHYYGLLFCVLAGNEHDSQKDILLERFRLFTDSYLHFFNPKSAPVAWGRSLAYRFAMLGCFGVGIRLGAMDEKHMGKIKEIMIATMNYFLQHEILNDKGILTMGYLRVNPLVLEAYSGPGSPYWALKAFSCLLLPPGHPFWKEREPASDVNAKNSQIFIPAAKMYVQNNSDGHVLLLNGGMNSKCYLAKYNRFAYSNIFLQSFDKNYVDNTFLFLDGQKRVMKNTIDRCEKSQDGTVVVDWGIEEIKGLKVRSQLAPMKDGYQLINFIDCPSALEYIYCGFNITHESFLMTENDHAIELRSGNLVSSLGVTGARSGKIGCQTIAVDKTLNGKESAVPYFRSSLPKGESEITFLVKGFIAER